MSTYFKDKTILLTGASSGIGASLAKLLSQQGAILLLCGRDTSRLQQVQETCGAQARMIQSDLTTQEGRDTLREASSNTCVDMDLLNAGTCVYLDADQFRADIFNQQLVDNVFTTAHCVEMVLPSLLSSKGQLVIMSSLAAYGGLTKASAYGASKAALRIMAQSLDLDLRPKGVCVSCICPGFVKTPLTDLNTFKMPFLLSTEKAGRIILRGIARQQHEIHFPLRFSLLMKVLTSLPASWQYHLLRNLSV